MNGLLADPTDIGEVMNSSVQRLAHKPTRGALLTASRVAIRSQSARH